MIHESAVQRCPQCRRSFRVLADEAGMHECPWCGYAPSTLLGQEISEEDRKRKARA